MSRRAAIHLQAAQHESRGRGAHKCELVPLSDLGPVPPQTRYAGARASVAAGI
jgi:hypothetical protein